MLDEKVRKAVVNYCNLDIIPNKTSRDEFDYPSQWFENYFSFLHDTNIVKHLGEAFYQARFMYKIMSGLRLSKAKYYAILKFQIIQYASIYEAILEYTIEKYFKNDFQKKYLRTEYHLNKSIMQVLKVTYKSQNYLPCTKKMVKKPIKLETIDLKTDFAVSKGIISQNTKDKIVSLYRLRNNVHILKAYETNYRPKIKEAIDAFKIMEPFIDEVKSFYNTTVK
ncbi:hypothetical protein [Caproicibacterium sp. BJN0003]|uniref:hypothetical protein n=1 Tax=Caproicibacterium sp. BJN0003 TaxID=2994078 RepID=UPI00225AA7B2|nr:hypothetical protein [Caproicibacterium sp. BJN0003]UZT82650.1 hypothetical protein OP489_02225 [Caproicibacterium sp. BJN0003]